MLQSSLFLKCIIQWFEYFILLCNYHHSPIPEHVSSLQIETLYPLAVTVPSPFLQPLAVTNLLSVSRALPLLDISFK